MTQCCPTCGRPYPPKFDNLYGPVTERIVEVINRRPGIGMPELADAVYADRLGGGPDNAAGCIAVLIYKIRQRIKPQGYTILSNPRGPGARYSIVKIENEMEYEHG